MILKNSISYGWNKILAESEKIVEISQSYDSELIKKKLTQLVPEYLPDSTIENDNFSELIKADLNSNSK